MIKRRTGKQDAHIFPAAPFPQFLSHYYLEVCYSCRRLYQAVVSVQRNTICSGEISATYLATMMLIGWRGPLGQSTEEISHRFQVWWSQAIDWTMTGSNWSNPGEDFLVEITKLKQKILWIKWHCDRPLT